MAWRHEDSKHGQELYDMFHRTEGNGLDEVVHKVEAANNKVDVVNMVEVVNKVEVVNMVVVVNIVEAVNEAWVRVDDSHGKGGYLAN